MEYEKKAKAVFQPLVDYGAETIDAQEPHRLEGEVVFQLDRAHRGVYSQDWHQFTPFPIPTPTRVHVQCRDPHR